MTVENISTRLKKFIKFKNISIRSFERSLNWGNSTVNNLGNKIGTDKMLELKDNYPELNLGWLIQNKGAMITDDFNEDPFSPKVDELKKLPRRQVLPNKEVDTVDQIEIPADIEFDENSEVVENSFGNRFVKLPTGEYLMYMPLFEWDVAASLLDNEGDTRHPDYEDIEQHVTIVKKPLQGKYSAFRIKGGSMEGPTGDKYIPDGSIVWGRELQFIHWRDPLRLKKHKLWVIASTDFGRPTLKEIVSHDTETATIVVDSWNPSLEYAHNVEIPLNTVKMLYYVFKIELPTIEEF